MLVWGLIQVRVVVVSVQALTRRLPRAAAAWLVLAGGLGALAGVVALVVRAVRAQWAQLVDPAGLGLDQVQNWSDTGPLDLGPAELTAAREG